jgi:membrane protein
LSTAIAALSHFLTPEAVPGGTALWSALNGLVSFGVITLLFALMYKVLPDVKVGWDNVWIGAVVTAGLFSLGKYLISVYLGQSGVASAYGAAGSLVLVLVWVYYSALLFLFGAVFTRVYAEQSGRRVGPADHADAIVPQASVDRLGPSPAAARPALRPNV